jgi:hypothetical protein
MTPADRLLWKAEGIVTSLGETPTAQEPEF